MVKTKSNVLISCFVHVCKSVKYSVEQQTGELAEEGQESDMFDPLTPDMEQDDAVDKLYGNLSDGEIQVFLNYYYVGSKHGLASCIISRVNYLSSVTFVRLPNHPTFLSRTLSEQLLLVQKTRNCVPQLKQS